MNKYEVGYEGEFIGVYYDETPEGAKRQCRDQMAQNNFVPETSAKDRIKGLIAIEV